VKKVKACELPHVTNSETIFGSEAQTLIVNTQARAYNWSPVVDCKQLFREHKGRENWLKYKSFGRRPSRLTVCAKEIGTHWELDSRAGGILFVGRVSDKITTTSA
jgi:hypothetical protein